MSKEKTPTDKFYSDIRDYAKVDIDPKNLSHYKNGDKEFWFKDRPIPGGYAGQGYLENNSMLEEMMILKQLGERNGMKLDLPLPKEVIEIGMSESGSNFVQNFLAPQEKGKVYRINNGIVVQKNGDDYFARKVVDLKVSDRSVPAQALLVDDKLKIISNKYRQPEDVQISCFTGESQPVPYTAGNFGEYFSGKLIPSKEDLKTDDLFNVLDNEEKKKYPFKWDPSDCSDKDGLSVISTCLGEGPLVVGTFPMVVQNPNFYSITSIIPIFTRENPKK